MKTRRICMLLALLLCLNLFTMPALAINDDPLFQGDGQVDHVDQPDEEIYVNTDVAEGDLRISHNGLEMIKSLEGCVNTPMWDVSQLSIGYGSSTVYAEKYGFSTTSLTDAEAEQLLLCVLGEMEKKLAAFVETYELELTQNQWDALLSFTYNIGTSWLKPSYRLADLLIRGDYTVNEFASAMGVWCHADDEINDILVLRRIREIKLFLYGAYELNDTPNKFCTLEFDASGGERTVDIAFYLEDAPYELLFDATHEDGLYLQGWYTLDGEKITPQTIVTDDLTVYARWSDEPVEPELEIEAEPAQPKESFTDVQDSDWFVPYLENLLSNGVIEGYPDGTFRPERIVTTGEALKMILLAAGYAQPEPVASHWARNFLNLSLDEGIIDRGEIRDLDIPISRGLMAKIVANAMGLTRTSEGQPFADTNDDYVSILFDHGLSDGYSDGTFQPQRSLTRAELTTIVSRMYDLR